MLNILKSKTILFSILLAVGGILEQSQAVITQLIGAGHTGYFMLGVSIVVAILRVVTTMPLTEK